MDSKISGELKRLSGTGGRRTRMSPFESATSSPSIQGKRTSSASIQASLGRESMLVT